MRLTGIRRILCPTDFSDCAREGLDVATTLAAEHGAELMALHVVGPSAAGAASSANDSRGLLDRLGALLAPVRAAGAQTRTAVVYGEVAAGIVDHAVAWPADLVVMGSRGRRPRSWGIGSVADQVVRAAPCPVLVVPLVPQSRPRAAFRRVLCATDFSEPAAEAVACGAGLAAASGAELLMLHVMEWFPEDDSALATTGAPEYGLDLAQEARERLAQAVPRGTGVGPREAVVVAGRPHREILRLSREREVDLIVLGIHSRRAVDVLLPGPTVFHVLREAACPVLAVPPAPSRERVGRVHARR